LKRYVVLLAVAAFLVAAMAVPAMAAPQGQVERGPEHANSICSFSGLNDDPAEGGQVQSYGQLVKGKDAAKPSAQAGPAEPGLFCNAHNFPLQEGGSPE